MPRRKSLRIQANASHLGGVGGRDKLKP
jgi:hypothetical protein